MKGTDQHADSILVSFTCFPSILFAIGFFSKRILVVILNIYQRVNSLTTVEAEPHNERPYLGYVSSLEVSSCDRKGRAREMRQTLSSQNTSSPPQAGRQFTPSCTQLAYSKLVSFKGGLSCATTELALPQTSHLSKQSTTSSCPHQSSVTSWQ